MCVFTLACGVTSKGECESVLGQRCPTFLAPGTSFVEDNFSTDGWVGMVQAVMRAMGSDGERQMKHHSLACCSPPAVQPGS